MGCEKLYLKCVDKQHLTIANCELRIANCEFNHIIENVTQHFITLGNANI